MNHIQRALAQYRGSRRGRWTRYVRHHRRKQGIHRRLHARPLGPAKVLTPKEQVQVNYWISQLQ